MQVLAPYKHTPGYLMLPISESKDGLSPDITLFGIKYILKKEFHVTLVYTNHLRSLHRISEVELLEVFINYAEKNDLTRVTYLPEYRLVSAEDGRKSIIQKVTIDGLDDFYKHASKKFGVSLSPPQTHITVYATNNRGIALETNEKYYNSFELRF